MRYDIEFYTQPNFDVKRFIGLIVKSAANHWSALEQKGIRSHTRATTALKRWRPGSDADTIEALPFVFEIIHGLQESGKMIVLHYSKSVREVSDELTDDHLQTLCLLLKCVLMYKDTQKKVDSLGAVCYEAGISERRVISMMRQSGKLQSEAIIRIVQQSRSSGYGIDWNKADREINPFVKSIIDLGHPQSRQKAAASVIRDYYYQASSRVQEQTQKSETI